VSDQLYNYEIVTIATNRVGKACDKLKELKPIVLDKHILSKVLSLESCRMKLLALWQ
jgi:hypothetical protein